VRFGHIDRRVKLFASCASVFTTEAQTAAFERAQEGVTFGAKNQSTP
jgi:hypothetical protein